MKTLLKYLVLTALFPVIVAIALYAGPIAFARGFHHKTARPGIVNQLSTSPPSIVNTLPPIASNQNPPVSLPASNASLQFGAFTGNTTPLGNLQAFFIGDRDSFTADAQGFTKPLVVYWESNLTAQQIASGQADSFLKNWATQMKAYPQTIIFDVLDEMNGNWSAYYGNPTAFKTAYQRVHGFFSDANVKFAYDPNVAFSGTPVSSFTDYYPGDAYVDLVALDGFNFGGQNFVQVFQSSLVAMKADFPSKPLWILSTGSVDNQSLFVQDMVAGAKQYGISGVVFFSYQQFVIPASTLDML